MLLSMHLLCPIIYPCQTPPPPSCTHRVVNPPLRTRPCCVGYYVRSSRISISSYTPSSTSSSFSSYSSSLLSSIVVALITLSLHGAGKNKVKHTQLCLQRSTTQRRLSILRQLDEVILPAHPCHHLCLVQHGPDAQRRRARILKALPLLQNRLSSRHSRSLHHILVCAPHRLNLEPAAHQLNALVRFALAGDADIVREAVLVELGVAALRAVGGGDNHADVRGEGVGGIVGRGGRDVPGGHVRFAGKGGSGGGGCRGGGGGVLGSGRR